MKAVLGGLQAGQLVIGGILLFTLVPGLVHATCVPSLEWTRSYNSPASDFDDALAVAMDGSGNVVVVGYEDRASDLGQNRNWLIQKFNAAGTLLWSQSYNSLANDDDRANGVAVDGSGNVIVVGGEFRGDLGQAWNWHIRKYSAAGSLLWSQSYNSPANSTDEAYGVAVDGSGNIIVAGVEYRGDLGQDFNRRVRKYSPGGGLLWSRSYNSPADGEDVAWSIAVDGSGNVVVVGREDRTSDLGQGGNWRIRKYDAAGTLLWSQDYNNPANSDDDTEGVAVDGSGNVVVVGSEFRSDLGESWNWRIRKYNAAGSLLWSRSYNSPTNGEDIARAVTMDGGGSGAGGI